MREIWLCFGRDSRAQPEILTVVEVRWVARSAGTRGQSKLGQAADMVRCCIRGAASDSFNRVRQDIGPRWQLGRGGCGKYAQPPGQQTWRLRPTPSVRSRLMGLAAAASHRMQQSNQGLVLTRGRVGGGRWRSHTFERGPKRVGRLGGDVGVPCRAATIPRLLVYKPH